MTRAVTASIIGGSGYTGGELARLLLDHPHARLNQITSRKLVGEPIHRAHPNLRGRSSLLFSDPEEIAPCDVLFLCMPHGESSKSLARYRAVAPLVIDLAADFRLRDPIQYEKWYGQPHADTNALELFVYGLPETQRDRLRAASLISGVGCNAAATILALLPLARAGLIERVVADVKVGSSEAGAESSASTHHAERSRALRTYAPTTHRHIAEIAQELGLREIHMTLSTTDLVRGVLSTCHIFTNRAVSLKELWPIYRKHFANEPFVRLVAERTGVHRLPDPKILAGSNFADIGFEVEESGRRVVSLCAIDNLMKGAAGTAIQAMNIAVGVPETAGLTFPGLHPC